MTSADHDQTKDAILDTATSPSWALQGRYSTDVAADPDRKFLAYVLGGSPGPGGPPQEVVLAYQYEGPAPRPKGWRCFKVASFGGTSTSTALTKIPFAPSPPFTPPPPLTAPQVARQNCVTSGIGGPKTVRAAPYHHP
jgi:hypothetical protein